MNITNKEFEIFSKVKKILYKKSIELNISLEEMIVLYFLYKIKEAKIKDIIDKYIQEYNLNDKEIQLKKIRVTQMTNNLVSKGLIIKSKNTKDKRSVIIKLTPLGEKLISKK